MGELDAVTEGAAGGQDGIAELKSADPDAEVDISRARRAVGNS